MVTEEKIVSNVVIRYRLGIILVWLGVFAWVPFIFLRTIGEKPSFLIFLPFHLIGVIGGSRLRSIARKELGLMPPQKNILHLAGHGMIFLGIMVWTPYLYSKFVMGQPVEAMNYLPYHLAGILGGVLLHVFSYLIERSTKR
jgi:hypothetical protein